MTTICDSCQRPGRCCSGFMLNSGEFPDGKHAQENMTADELKKRIKENPQPDVNGDIVSVMFEPMWKDSQGRWRYWCSAWKNGRCSIYHRRPQLCKDYQALQDPGCWHMDETVHATLPKPRERGIVIDLLSKEAPDQFPKEVLTQ